MLDFGCGEGRLVRELLTAGHDAYGCDLGGDWIDPQQAWTRGLPAEQWRDRHKLSAIQASPYRLPYADGFFDAVVSTSVMEHAQNKAEIFREIQRVLKPAGAAVHWLPSKWYLPTEPHIFVPFVSWLWPNVPRWWLSLWAFLGVRDAFQKGLGWRETAAANAAYCATGLHYLSRRAYERLVSATGGEPKWLDEFYAANMQGGAASLLRRLRFIPPALVLRFRMQILLVSRGTGK